MLRLLKTARGPLQIDTVAPADLSRQLRRGRGGFLKNRRGVLALTLTAAGSMGVVSLYQLGVIKHLPELPLPLLDADKVDASEEAYEWLSTPDGPVGLLSYAATAVLTTMGGADRARRSPWLPLALAAKLGADAAQAGVLSYDQWAEHRAFCSWCLLAAGATFGALALALPEAKAALGHFTD